MKVLKQLAAWGCLLSRQEMFRATGSNCSEEAGVRDVFFVVD